MKEPKLKKLPSFSTDQEVENFIDNADLSAYDFSDFKTVKYELDPKSATIICVCMKICS